MRSRYQALIQEMSTRYQVAPSIVEAIVLVESSDDPWATRYEPGYRWLYEVEAMANIAKVPHHTEESLQKHSFGLMQVMGAVAREHGFRGRYLTELCDPAKGLEYGCRHVRFLMRRFGEQGQEAVIAAYNAGSPRKHDALFDNQEYVNKVLALWTLIG